MDRRTRWRLFLLIGVLAPAAMGAVGLLLARLATGQFPDLLRLPSGQAVLAGLVVGGTSLGLIGLLSRWGPLEDALRKTATRVGEEALRSAGYPMMLVLVTTSALGEELLFRGGLQPLVGLLPAAFLFGFSHGGWMRDNWAYAAVAAASGAIFGGAYALTGDLWAPAIGHSIHNILSTLLLGRHIEVEWRGPVPVIRLVPDEPPDATGEEVAPMSFTSPYPSRPTARALGLITGHLPPGPQNDICDVPGVRVGHATRVEGEGPLVPGRGPVRTGVTAILPHGGNLFKQKVPAGLFVLNGFGKATGLAQVAELGTIETPILLTNTLSAFRAADALVSYMLEQNPEIGVTTGTVNPVVGECNDSFLNDVQGRHVTAEMVRAALDGASGGPVAQGAVGAGTGMVCFGFKGGIGSSSRRVDRYVLGALVLANFGRRPDLLIHGVPVGRRLLDYPEKAAPVSETAPAPQPEQESAPQQPAADSGSEFTPDEPPPGSVMIVLATDAPLDARQLTRLAKRGRAGARPGGRQRDERQRRLRAGLLHREPRAASGQLPREGGDPAPGRQRDHERPLPRRRRDGGGGRDQRAVHRQHGDRARRARGARAAGGAGIVVAEAKRSVTYHKSIRYGVNLFSTVYV